MRAIIVDDRQLEIAIERRSRYWLPLHIGISYRDKHARFDLDHARSRRFPPPWTIDEMNDACFIVRDRNGQALAYVYFEEEAGQRAATHAFERI